MQLLLGLTLLVSSVAAQACGARGNIASTAPITGSGGSSDAYDCGRTCAVTTRCQSWVVGGPEGCQLVAAGVSSFFTANDSSPYQFYQKYSCDYTTLRSTPALSIPTPTPTGGVCGVKGWDQQKPGSFYAYLEAAYRTVGGCYLQCNDRGSSCAAFGINGNYCLLYSSKMGGNFVVDPGSETTYYDMNCFVVGSAVSSSVTQAPATSAPTAVPSSSATSKADSAPAVTPTATQGGDSSSTSNTCGVAGWDKQKPAAFLSGASSTVEACTALCKSNASCKSFASGGGICLLYSAAAADNVAADAGSAHIFYDVGCFSGSSAPTSASATAAASTLKTSTTSTTSAAASSTNLCNWKGYETSTADSSILAAKYKPSAGCKSFCSGKSAKSYEQYYDYCICFSKAVKSISTKDTTSPVIFNDIAC